MANSLDRVVIVTKLTRLEELVRGHLTEGAARFSLESRGQSIGAYKEEDAAYKAALFELRRQIPNDLTFATVVREGLPNFLFRDNDLIIACGPDGLFANLAKYAGEQPILTVNPDPKTIAGVLMLHPPRAVGSVIAKVREGKHEMEALPFIRASIDDDRIVWGINDVFLGRKDHVSARYEISFERESESQSSGGIIVSTGVGSTGWVRSVTAMVEGLTHAGASHDVLQMPGPTDDELVFVVREPFPSPTTGTRIVSGRISPDEPLLVNSQMPEGGYIFSDGVVEKAVEWRAGSTATVSVGDRYVHRIVR